MTMATVETTTVVAISNTEINVITADQEAVNVVTVAEQGMPGIGVPTGGTTGQVLKKKTNENFDTEWGVGGGGSGSTLEQIDTLGETLSAYRIVYSSLDGSIYAASNNDLMTAQSVHGITTQAGNSGEDVSVTTEGVVTNSGWAWSGNQNLYLGVAGVVTDTPPTSGFILRVGYATGAQSMYVDIGTIIVLN